MSGIFTVGGGLVVVPALVTFFGMPQTRAQGMALALVVPGTLIALAHRPELLVLDEPSSGLDPVVRRDILGAIIRTIADEGRTVLFSSHLLDEVERVADQVTMIHQGRIVLSETMDDVKLRHRRLGTGRGVW